MALISGIHHVSLKCKTPQQYDEVIRFYHDILGLEILRTFPTGTMLDTGAGIIEVFNNAEDVLELGVIRHFALATDDVDACVQAVRQAGYEVFVGPKDVEIQSNPIFPIRMAFCRGPLGEEIEFFKER